MGEGHLPVLVDEVLASLDPRPGSSIADCTLGGGGHAERLLEATSPDGRLLGLDADRAAIREAERVLAQYGERVVLRQANFAQIHDVAREAGFVPLDGVLFDLGLSSYQLADPSRGFSFVADAPPDMRFDEDRGLSALDLIDRSSHRELAGILATFGEERRAGRIAKAILAARQEGRLMTAADLATVVARAVPARGADAGRIHPATRTFQALRIAVNRELEVLGTGLAGALASLRPGGRMAVISYHSGEDRIVKRFMARESRDCVEEPLPPVCTCGHRAQLRIVARGGITPSQAEVRRNRRARSARLRVAEKLPVASAA
ncbi:MAG TPA: 16S rRNA (cytosine(1402)-N(4))-methyltransferase RsmH [Candidatus Limnocylindria bacterium]